MHRLITTNNYNRAKWTVIIIIIIIIIVVVVVVEWRVQWQTLPLLYEECSTLLGMNNEQQTDMFIGIT